MSCDEQDQRFSSNRCSRRRCRDARRPPASAATAYIGGGAFGGQLDHDVPCRVPYYTSCRRNPCGIGFSYIRGAETGGTAYTRLRKTSVSSSFSPVSKKRPYPSLQWPTSSQVLSTFAREGFDACSRGISRGSNPYAAGRDDDHHVATDRQCDPRAGPNS